MKKVHLASGLSVQLHMIGLLFDDFVPAMANSGEILLHIF